MKSAFFYSDCRKKILRNIGVRVIDELLPEILSWLIAGLDRARGRSIPRSPFFSPGLTCPPNTASAGVYDPRFYLRGILKYLRPSVSDCPQPRGPKSLGKHPKVAQRVSRRC